MSVFGAMNVSATGMTAQSVRRDIISQNIANVNTTRDANGKPYKKKNVVFEEKSVTSFAMALDLSMGATGIGLDGVKVSKIVEDDSEGRMVYDPSHPDADEDGYVTCPNVNVVQEMTDLIDASRAYEANVTAFNASKSMYMKTLEMGK
ncbi:flagellar basal body rod protein FlgC [Acetivibrio ethanolgignens]|uniref:Flagellar basal-body rod protein FlgC n=1 Tax=Acetivibrio ethanolgignens TaxID=290052 RepID=A0A0V8QJE2_9FIRM|nr:flagellar basal body rod protein FlgC [Acetivibrio ethanolgignens]KSV60672.1 flagellar basal-body rod protein FlgC [Acetivibrio ethanolgignens]